jgi:glycosyltransferase involved in cell wall biosynthesis
VLHVLAVSIPYLNGYTIRSKYIVETQRQQGLEPVVVTSPFYAGVEASSQDAVIGGITYRRIPHPIDATGELALPDRLYRLSERIVRSRAAAVRKRAAPPLRGSAPWPARPYRMAMALLHRLTNRVFAVAKWPLKALQEALLLRRFERELVRIAREVEPDVLHAHSPYRCGLPALAVSRRLRLPLVYEVRGLWEESAVAGGRFRSGDVKYRFWRRKETQAMKGADAVVCICEALRSEVVRRGVPAERVFVVPNAADTSVFRSRAKEPPESIPGQVSEVRRRLRPHTLGYVGSLRRLEGVDELVRAAAEVVRRGHDISLLVVGDGPDLDELKALAAQEGIADRSVFTGQVPHEHVSYYYDCMDIFVLSRPALRVTELVTPLKPLEAMAMGKALVASDLPSLREIVEEGQTGLLYRPGHPDDLADKCARLLQDAPLRLRLGQAAQQWVQQERTWSAVLRRLGPAYQFALGRAAKRYGRAHPQTEMARSRSPTSGPIETGKT